MVSTDEVVLRLAEAEDDIERLKLIIERERRTSSAAIRDRESYRVRCERAEQAEVCLLDHVADLKAKLAQSEGDADHLRDTIVDQRNRIGQLKSTIEQTNGHNDMLRGQVKELRAELKAAKRQIEVDAKDHARIRARIEELQAALEMAQESRFISATCVTAPDGRLVPMQMWTSGDVRAQAIADSAEPQFTAQEMSDAKAVNEAEAEYQRVARGEIVSDACSKCGGAGIVEEQRGLVKICPRCGGSGFALVHDGAPAHLVQEPRDCPPVEPEGDEPAVATDCAF